MNGPPYAAKELANSASGKSLLNNALLVVWMGGYVLKGVDNDPLPNLLWRRLYRTPRKSDGYIVIVWLRRHCAWGRVRLADKIIYLVDDWRSRKNIIHKHSATLIVTNYIGVVLATT